MWNVARAGARCAYVGTRAGVRYLRSTHAARTLFDAAMLLLAFAVVLTLVSLVAGWLT